MKFNPSSYQKLEQIYREIDQDWGNLSQPCTSCGQCCHFDLAEHRLYITSLEASWALEKYPSFKPNSDTCPYLLNGKCTARDRRMIGCRTYFRLHSKEERNRAEEIYEKALYKIKLIYKEQNIPWKYQDLMSYFPEDQNAS